MIKPRTGNHGANVTVGVTSAGPGGRGLPAGQHQRRRGRRRGIRSWPRLPGPGGGRAPGGRGPAAPGVGDRRRPPGRSRPWPGRPTPTRAGAKGSRALTRSARRATRSATPAQGLAPGSVPGPGEVVKLRRNANCPPAAQARDVTDRCTLGGGDVLRAPRPRPGSTSAASTCGWPTSRACPAPLPAGGRRHRDQRLRRACGCTCEPSGAGCASRRRDRGRAVPARRASPAIPIVSVTGTNGKTTTVQDDRAPAAARLGPAVGMATHGRGLLGGTTWCTSPTPQARGRRRWSSDDSGGRGAVLGRPGAASSGVAELHRADSRWSPTSPTITWAATAIYTIDDLTWVQALVAEIRRRHPSLRRRPPPAGLPQRRPSERNPAGPVLQPAGSSPAVMGPDGLGRLPPARRPLIVARAGRPVAPALPGADRLPFVPSRGSSGRQRTGRRGRVM